ncbi:MAG: peptidoglycan-binding protein [Halopseudomonas sp.]
MKNGIFISYRREDADGFARSLFQSLTAHFGSDQIFMDVEDIELGLDFIEAIDKSLSSCGVLLVLIGKEWLSCVDSEGQPRLENPDDFVRMEVASALRRKIRVIPVQVRGAAMPKSSQLPEELQQLTRKQALELHHDRWNADIEQLISALENALGITAKTAPGDTQGDRPADAPPAEPAPAITAPKPSSKKSTWIGLIAALVISLALVELFSSPEAEPDYVFTGDEPNPIPSPQVMLTPKQVEPEIRNSPPDDAVFKYQSETVMEVQQRLAELGYSPGAIDGQLGGKTSRAILAFQRDASLNADGQVSEQLLGSLHESLIKRQQQATNTAAAPPPQLLNISSTWYDDDGFQYAIVQQGNQVNYQAMIPLLGTVVGMGEGILRGRTLTYRFMVADGSQGNGVGTLSADGQHMEYIATYQGTGMQQSGRLHREHTKQ